MNIPEWAWALAALVWAAILDFRLRALGHEVYALRIDLMRRAGEIPAEIAREHIEENSPTPFS